MPYSEFISILDYGIPSMYLVLGMHKRLLLNFPGNKCDCQNIIYPKRKYKCHSNVLDYRNILQPFSQGIHIYSIQNKI